MGTLWACAALASRNRIIFNLMYSVAIIKTYYNVMDLAAFDFIFVGIQYQKSLFLRFELQLVRIMILKVLKS